MLDFFFLVEVASTIFLDTVKVFNGFEITYVLITVAQSNLV